MSTIDVTDFLIFDGRCDCIFKLNFELSFLIAKREGSLLILLVNFGVFFNWSLIATVSKDSKLISDNSR